MRRLSPLLLFLFAASATAAVTGTVISDDGAPLAGARIRAFACEPFSAIAARLLSDAPEATPIATAESGTDGRFSIDAKGHTTVDLVVDAAGRAPAAFAAADADDAGMIPLRPLAKVPRVRVTADGKPVPNALVYLGHSLLLRSDAQGMFPYELTGDGMFVVHPDYGPNPLAERNGEVQLHRNAAVQGRVVGRDGTTPVAGATVSAGGWPLARSGADGTFTIAHPPRVRALLAVSGNDAGVATIRPAKPIEIRVGTAASLSGSVTAKGQTPIAGAMVGINGGGETYSAVTDAKGRYLIPALPPGGYRAQASHPAYVNAGIADLAVSPSSTRSFVLPARARIRGTVSTDDRKPAAGAFVGVASGSSGNAIAVAGPAGEFVLRVAVNGPLFLAASKDGYATTISPRLAVDPGETKSGVTLTLQRGFPLQVKVVDADRQPVAKAAVDLFSVGENDRNIPVPCNVADRAQCRVTGTDGTVERRLAEGKYDVRVTGDFVAKQLPEQSLTARSSPLLVTVIRGADVSGRVLFADGTPVADARVSVDGGSVVAVADANGVFTLRQLPRVAQSLIATSQDELPLRSEPVKVTPPARDVKLTIATPASIEGRVADRATSQPVTSFNVSVSAPMRSFVGRGIDVSSPDGAFVLKRVQPGSLTLHVTAPGYVSGTVSDLAVEEGKALTNVEVKLDRGARVVGHVTAGGNPVAGVTVRYGGRSAVRRIPPSATSDANGDYVLDGVPAGEETIDFTKQGFVTKRKSVELAAGKEVRVDVDLDRGREIRGRVIDKSGQPVAGARIAAAAPSAPFASSAQSGDDGQFTVSGLEDAQYKVSAQKNGYVGASVDDVDPAAGRSITLTLDRGATITGRVVGLPAEELPSVRVGASARNASASAQADASGNFTVTGMPDGNVTLIAYRQGFPSRQSAPKIVTVSNGSAPPVEIDFNSGYSIRGRVTRNGLPVNGGNVNFTPRARGGLHSASGMISTDGSYEVDGVDLGDYDVRVNTMGGGNDAVPYTVVGSSTFDIDLKGAAIRGVVVDAATGVPLADVRIYSSPAAPPLRVWRNTVSDSDGRFLLDMLPDGTYNVRAEREHYGVTTQPFTVSGGTAPPLELRLTRGQEVAIRIVDADTGRAVDGSVALFDAQKKYVGNSMGRGEDGATHVWAAPGRYNAQIRANGYLPQNIDVTVPGPEVRVALSRAATLVITSRTGGRFRVVPPGAAVPVAGSRLSTAINVPPGERVPINALTAGVYEVDKLSADGKSVTNKYTVVLTGGQTATLDAD